MTNNPRQVALQVLLRFEKGGATRLKADSLLAEALGNEGKTLSDSDRGFAHALVMGTLRHWLRLDEWLKNLTGRPLKNIEPAVRCLLRLGLFQLYGLSQVPAYAAIDATVELAKARRVSPKTVKFVNAVLREGQRRLEANGFPVPDAEADLAGHLLWQAGWPEALTRHLLETYAPADILAMAHAVQTPAPLTLRVNMLKTTPAAYRKILQGAGYTVSLPEETVPECFLVEGFSGSPRQLPGYLEGLFYVQDPASMAVARFLDPQPQDQVLDLCAAPGSKTTHLAALMGNAGQITAVEPKPERMRLLEENIARLGVNQVQCQVADGLAADLPENHFDRVLVDAPCSGSGTLRRHPEILLQMRKPDLSAFAAQQLALLERGFALLKPGGFLVYSTCSVFSAENQAIVTRFLSQHGDAILETQTQRLITPQADGFYMARLRKRNHD